MRLLTVPPLRPFSALQCAFFIFCSREQRSARGWRRQTHLHPGRVDRREFFAHLSFSLRRCVGNIARVANAKPILARRPHPLRSLRAPLTVRPTSAFKGVLVGFANEGVDRLERDPRRPKLLATPRHLYQRLHPVFEIAAATLSGSSRSVAISTLSDFRKSRFSSNDTSSEL